MSLASCCRAHGLNVSVGLFVFRVVLTSAMEPRDIHYDLIATVESVQAQ